MSWIIIVALIALGIIFLLLELLVVPGTTFIGIVGLIALLLGVYQTFVLYGTGWGTAVLIATLIFSVAALVLSLRSKTWKKAMLSTSIDSKVEQVKDKISVGEEGYTISRLTPMGKARFGTHFLEVSSFGDFLNQDSKIRIVEIKNNKIFVELVTEK